MLLVRALGEAVGLWAFNLVERRAGRGLNQVLFLGVARSKLLLVPVGGLGTKLSYHVAFQE